MKDPNDAARQRITDDLVKGGADRNHIDSLTPLEFANFCTTTGRGDTLTYADRWADAINETYTDAREDPSGFMSFSYMTPDGVQHGEDNDAKIGRVLLQAADALRLNIPATFNGEELDIVRHLMPAHEVHQSGAKRWVLDHYGVQSSNQMGDGAAVAVVRCGKRKPS